MKKFSAGILVFRRQTGDIEILLLHLGGPFWAKKDSWTLPKGEAEPYEEKFAAAKREFREEVGITPPDGKYIDLGQIDQSPDKTNIIWAVEGDLDVAKFKSNEFSMEWPPRSGKIQSFPECDRAEWFSLDQAKEKILKAQAEFIGRLESHLVS